eukprot:76777_1
MTADNCHVTKEEILHGLSEITMVHDIETLEQLLRTKCIKRTHFKSLQMNEYNQRAVAKTLSSSSARFKMSNLMANIDAKVYHDIFEAGDTAKRACMHSRRSKYAMAFANQYIGRDFKHVADMSNNEWNYALRSCFGLNINLFDYDVNGYPTELRCNACNHPFASIADILIHSWKCKRGKSAQWRHDQFNKMIYNRLLRIAFTSARLEPRRINDND